MQDAVAHRVELGIEPMPPLRRVQIVADADALLLGEGRQQGDGRVLDRPSRDPVGWRENSPSIGFPSVVTPTNGC